jgi:hypothetical protein
MLDPLSHLTDRPVRGLINGLQEGVHTLFQLLLLCLLVLGLAGLVYKAVGPEGWLQSVLGRVWETQPVTALIGLIVIVISGAWLIGFLERLPLFGKSGDWLVYGCLALGFFFAVRLIATGSL